MPKKQRLRSNERTVELGGETRTLTRDNAAIADIHTHTGINLLNPAAYEEEHGKTVMAGLLEPANFHTVIWAFLGGEDCEFTARQVGRWLVDNEIYETLAHLVVELISGNSEEGGSKNAGKAEIPSP